MMSPIHFNRNLTVSWLFITLLLIIIQCLYYPPYGDVLSGFCMYELIRVIII